MGYAVLHLLKSKGASSPMSAHIERTVSPANADAQRTHLNRELIEFPETVSNRTEAIQHRIDTAGLQRKVGKNQHAAFNVLLTGSHDEMKQLEANGKLNEWCRDNLDWLRKTYGAENLVSAVLHLDEMTPHIHATVTPIVTTERKKKKHEEQAKKHYRKKSPNSARLCLDEIMSREKLKEYQDTYATAMAKYGLQRGIKGSDARHVSTSEYYRELINQTSEVKATLNELEQQKAAAETELSKVKSDISKEKLKNSAADVGATLLDGVGSLFGSSKAKQQQQKIEALETENCNLTTEIKSLNTKIKTMETEHKTAIEKLSEQINKIFNYFPHIKELLRWENFLKNMRLPEDMIRRLFNKETVNGSGNLYSTEHSQSFKAQHANLRLEQDKEKPQNINLTIDDRNIHDWFRQKHREFLHSIGINPSEQKNNRGLKI